MSDTKRTSPRPAVLAVLFMAAVILAQCAGCVEQAYAAETTQLVIGGTVPYAGYSTTWMYADGDRIAYCAEPSKETPLEGSYEKEDVVLETDAYTIDQLRSVLWYGYGGPGFDPAMWPAAWYDGSPMDDERYLALTHIIVSDVFASNGGAAVYGCYPSFQTWVYNYVIGVNMDDPDAADPNAIERRMVGVLVGTVPESFEIFMLNSGNWSQTISYSAAYTPAGAFALLKTAGSPTIATGNRLYSLDGAVYAVYRNRNDAEAQENAWFTQWTGQDNPDTAQYARAEGYWETAYDIAPGTYWIREASAPSGYALDPTVHRVDVRDGELTLLEVADEPLAAFDIPWVVKTDSETGGIAQGAATLAGAEFDVRYYDGFYAADELPDAPTRQWTMATDADGFVRPDVSYLASGDNLYFDANGNVALPLGTVAVRETKAPNGYLLDDKRPAYIYQIAAENGQVHVEPLNYASTSPAAPAPSVANDVKRGGLAIQKADADTADGAASAGMSLSGARFAIVNGNENPVVIGNTSIASGETVLVIETDKTGHAATDPFALPYGSYEVHEIKAPVGYALDSSWSAAIDIAEDGIVISAGTCADEPLKGGIAIEKRDSETGTTTPQGDASLKGTAFSVSGEGCSVTIAVDENGIASTGQTLPVGTYIVREAQAGTGYETDASWSATVQVKAGEIAYINGEDSPANTVVRGGLRIAKSDRDTAGPDPQGDASLAGAQFGIVNRSSEPVLVDGVLCGPGEIACTISTDSSGCAATAPDALPYGTYEVRETQAPSGYLLDETWSIAFEIREKDVQLEFDASDQVIRGGLVLSKFDRESQSAQPLGAASLAGAVFELTNLSASPVMIDGVAYAPGDVVATLETSLDADGQAVACTEPDALPCGTYGLRELEAPEGYLLDDGWHKTFSIRRDGQIEDLANSATAIGNQVIRADIAFEKADRRTGARMAGVPFMIESLATGEAHVLVTDEHGTASTATSQAPHTDRTNANDNALQEDGTVDAAMLDSRSGVWFGGTAPDDALGALPYDTYTLTELRCDANDGYELASLTVSVTRDGIIADLGTVENNRPVSIGTSLTDKAGVHMVCAVSEAQVIDTVSFGNLAPGSYIMRSELHRRNADGADGGTVAHAETPFETTDKDGTVEVGLTLDASDLEGCDVVAFEKLLDANGIVYAEHADITDEGQTVHIPHIGTELTCNGNHSAPAVGTVSLVDTVSYENLIPKRPYALAGALHLRNADGTDAGALRNAEGIPVSTSIAFVPDEASGSVDLAFDVDTGLLDGRTIVAFEALACGTTVYAAHADIADEGQSIVFPQIATKLSSAAGEDQFVAPEDDKAIELIDTIRFENLSPGTSYELRGMLHARAEDGTDAGVLVGADNQPASSSTTFVPDAASGTTEVRFSFEEPDEPVRSIVAFEELWCDGELVAQHADIANADQTVTRKPLQDLPGTGDAFAGAIPWLAFAGAAASCGVALALARCRHRR